VFGLPALGPSALPAALLGSAAGWARRPAGSPRARRRSRAALVYRVALAAVRRIPKAAGAARRGAARRGEQHHRGEGCTGAGGGPRGAEVLPRFACGSQYVAKAVAGVGGLSERILR
jgi:hypothetical protein